MKIMSTTYMGTIKFSVAMQDRTISMQLEQLGLATMTAEQAIDVATEFLKAIDILLEAAD